MNLTQGGKSKLLFLWLVILLLSSCADGDLSCFQQLRHLDDRARVLAIAGTPDSERSDSLLGLRCSVLDYREHDLLSFTVTTASLRLCGVAGGDRLVSITTQTRRLLAR